MDMYPADDEAKSGQAPNGADGKGEDESKENMGGETTLVPNSLFGGKTPKPGTECKFKVVHCYDDECEVEYMPMDKGDKPGQSSMDEADSQMAASADMA